VFKLIGSLFRILPRRGFPIVTSLLLSMDALHSASVNVSSQNDNARYVYVYVCMRIYVSVYVCYVCMCVCIGSGAPPYLRQLRGSIGIAIETFGAKSVLQCLPLNLPVCFCMCLCTCVYACLCMYDVCIYNVCMYVCICLDCIFTTISTRSLSLCGTAKVSQVFVCMYYVYVFLGVLI